MKNNIFNIKGGFGKAIAMALAAVVTSGGLLFSLAGDKVNAAYVTPRLIVTGSEIGTDTVNAGDEFEMTIHLKNESTVTPLNNVKIELVSNENDIIPSSGTNVTYIDSIAKEAEVDVVVDLQSKGDLKQDIYSIQVNMEYEDKDRNSYDSSSEVTVPIKQVPSLSVSDFKLSRKEVAVNGKTNMSFSLNNVGKDLVYNVSVDIIGDQIDQTSTYVGNLEVGLSKTVDLSLLANKLGTGTVKAKINFEDADGKKYSVDQDVELSVIEAPKLLVEEPGLAPDIDLRIVGIGAAALVAIIVVVTLIRKAREKKYA